MSSFTLYGKQGSHRTNKLLTTAEVAGVTLNLVDADMKLIKSKDFTKKNPLAKIPVLETDKGCIYESNAILKFLGSFSQDQSLLGSSVYENGLVDQFVDYVNFEVEPAANAYISSVYG
jgi:glutathione S-transferase